MISGIDAVRSGLMIPRTGAPRATPSMPRTAGRRELVVRSRSRAQWDYGGTVGRCAEQDSRTDASGTVGAVERMERTERDTARRSGACAGRTAARRRPAPRAAGGFTFSAADEEQRRGVRRMKTHRHRAAAARRASSTSWPSGRSTRARAAGPGYVAAAAEAGMVGALADWFAVTALFRHPLGPAHPAHRDHPHQEGPARAPRWATSSARTSSPATSYGSRLRAVGIGSRLGAWLAEPEHADRVTAELATALRGALTVLRDSDVQAVVGEAITRRADAQEIAPGHRQDAGEDRRGRRPPAGRGPGLRPRPRLAGRCTATRSWTRSQGGAPGWTPRFVDRKVGERVYKELLRFVTEMRDMPEHPARGALDRFLHRLRRRPPVRHGHPGAGRAAQVARCWAAARCRT